MSYFFKLNNRFWQLDRQEPFTAHETRLFFYLLNAVNEDGWPEIFSRSDPRICGDVGMSTNGMKNARTRLEDAGFFIVEAGGKGKKDITKYHFRYHDMIPKVIPKSQSRYHGVIPKVIPTGEENDAKVSVQVSPHDTYSIYKRLKTFSISLLRVRHENFTPSAPDAEGPPTTPHSAPPPASPGSGQAEGSTEPDRHAERVAVTQKLQANRDLLYVLSNVLKVKGEEAQDWIEQFVAIQWAAQNLKGRNNKELISHCISWIKTQIQTKQDREQRQYPRPFPAGNAGPGQTTTGFANRTTKRTGFIPAGGLNRKGQGGGGEDSERP